MLPLIRSLALFTLLSAAPILSAENLVPNPGFEAGQEGWRLFIPPGSEGANVQWTVVKDDPHSGAGCLSMKSASPVRWAVLGEKFFTVLPGAKYRVQAWVKFSKDTQIQPGAPGAYVRVTFEGFGHIQVGLAGVARIPAMGKLAMKGVPSGWQKIEAVIESPVGFDRTGFELFSHGVTGTIFWDDVSYELVDSKTPTSKILE